MVGKDDRVKVGDFCIWFKTPDEPENRPKISGNITLNGEKYLFAGWPHETKDGKPYISGDLSIAKNEEYKDQF